MITQGGFRVVAYVAQAPSGGWYGDCEGVMQDSDERRSQVAALEWVVDRLAIELGRARHGCERQSPPCLLHSRAWTEEIVAAMRQQMREDKLATPPDWPTTRYVFTYSQWRKSRFEQQGTSA